MRRLRVTLALAAALSAPLVVSCPPRADASPPHAAATDANPTAKALVTKFFTLIQHHDVAGLKTFLSPAFQLERADGTGAGKADYLTKLPTVTSFDLTRISATRTGSVLAVRYLAVATGVVNGKAYTPGPAPRLSVFVRNGRRWQIVAHANFNPLTG